MRFEHDGRKIPMAPDYKDPDSTADCRGCDWSEWLLSGETINTSIWTITPSDMTSVRESNSGTVTEICLSGGTAGKTYTLTNTIITTGLVNPRSESRSMYLRCENI